jgi:hypothetical protein
MDRPRAKASSRRRASASPPETPAGATPRGSAIDAIVESTAGSAIGRREQLAPARPRTAGARPRETA